MPQHTIPRTLTVHRVGKVRVPPEPKAGSSGTPPVPHRLAIMRHGRGHSNARGGAQIEGAAVRP